MTSLDRLNWAARLSLTAFGVQIGIRVDDGAWLPRLCERLPHDWPSSDSGVFDYLYSFRRGGLVAGSRIRRFFVGCANAEQIVRTLDEDVALDAFQSRVRFDVAVSATQWAFVHAGVVGWNGRAIVIPASSTFGKSRLVEALVRAGAEYYSDETAAIDAEGLVHPFAQSLKLRQRDGGVLRVTPAEIGGTTGVAPLPIGLVLSTKFEDGASWRPRVGTPGEAHLALLGHAIRARLDPRTSLQILASAVTGARMLEGPRGEADVAAGQILATPMHS